MSQQQNLSSVSQSLLRQPDYGADVKPFSIRQYVLASRRSNIFHSWPFHEKYLQFCLNHGLKEVLPPFGRQTSLADPLNVGSNLMHSPNDNNKEAQFCKAEVQRLNDDHSQNIKIEGDYKIINQPSSDEEEKNQHNCSNISVNLYQQVDTCTLPSSIHESLQPSKAVKDKRKRRRRRCKKRSMVDILTVARL